MNSLLYKQQHARKKILFLFVERKLHSLIYQSYLVKHVPHKSLTLIHITMFVIHVLDKNLYIIHNKKFVKLVLKEENIIIKQENVTISKIIKSLLLFIHKTQNNKKVLAIFLLHQLFLNIYNLYRSIFKLQRFHQITSNKLRQLYNKHKIIVMKIKNLMYLLKSVMIFRKLVLLMNFMMKHYILVVVEV